MTSLSATISGPLLEPPTSASAWAQTGRAATSASADRSSPLTFSVVSTRAQFDALQVDWCALFEQPGAGQHIFQNFHWLWHWCNHYLDEQQGATHLTIVTGRKHGKLVLVWPLVTHRVGAVKQLLWMGQPVSQYGDILIDRALCSNADLKASWQFIKHSISADIALLRKVRADAHVYGLLKEQGHRPLTQETAPFLDLSSASSFEDYQTRYSGKARKNRRRLRRRIEERASLSTTTHAAGATRADLAAKAVVLKRAWLKARGLISHAIQDDRTRSFFADAANSSAHPTGCHATELKIDDTTAAIEVSFVTKSHCAVHVIVYDLKHEKSGAGVLLMEDSIRSAFASGIKTFDLMAPGDNYKLDWADGTVEVCDWSLPLSPLGQAFVRLKLDKLPTVFKSSLHALPLKARQVLHRGFSRHACRHT